MQKKKIREGRIKKDQSLIGWSYTGLPDKDIEGDSWPKDTQGEHTIETPDGQPRDNWYSPVMVDRDVIANSIEKFRKAGITYQFHGNDLMITAGTYSTSPQADVQEELKMNIAEIIKFVKEEYKGVTGKALKIGAEETETFDCVANYTTNHLTLCRLTCVFHLPGSTADDDSGIEKAEIRGEVPVISPKYK